MADVNNVMDQLKQMLSDPQQMEKLKPLMDMVMQGGGNPGGKKAPQRPPVTNDTEEMNTPFEEDAYDSGMNVPPPQGSQQAPGAGGSSGMNMDTIMKVKSLYDSVSADDDPRMNLLSAIRPYMRAGRVSKLDSAMKILKVTKIGSAMKGFGKF